MPARPQRRERLGFFRQRGWCRVPLAVWLVGVWDRARIQG